MTTLSFHGKQSVKDDIDQRMLGHIERDELVRGTGFDNGRGCAVGCTYDTYDHADVARRSGVPEQLIRLLDTLHERTSAEVWKPAKGYPLALRFWRAIPVGVDLQPVVHRLHAFIQQRNAERTDGDVKAVCERVRDLHLRAAKGDNPSNWEWEAARSASRSAALSAERSAGWSAGWSSAALSAARSAGWSAQCSAEALSASAADWSAESAARSAEWSAGSAEYDAIANELLRLLSTAGDEYMKESRDHLRPMEDAPKDKKILAWCEHEQDTYVDTRREPLGKYLTDYGCHCESGNSHVSDGWHVLEWGGGGVELGEYGVTVASWPDWWFQSGSDFEKPASPVGWLCSLEDKPPEVEQ